jgi:hypothetical protein
LTTLLTALISLQATTICFPNWRNGCDHSISTIMRSWLKVSKRGWAHSWQTFLTQTYKNLFPNMTSASILAVSTLRSSLNYVFFVYNKFFLIARYYNIYRALHSQLGWVRTITSTYCHAYVTTDRVCIGNWIYWTLTDCNYT